MSQKKGVWVTHYLFYFFKHPPVGLTLSIICIIIYFALSLGFLFLTMNNELSVLDCFYFAVVIVTTVGYGDVLPDSDNAKLFTSFYVLFALVIAGMAISQFIDSVSSMVEEEMEGDEGKDGEEALFHDKAEAQSRRRMEFVKSVLTFFVLLVVSTSVNALGHEWGEDDGSKWVNGFYYTVITLTTVGFGDLSPTEDWEKVFQMVMMIVGIPVFASCLGALSSVLFAEQREELKLRLVAGGLTHNKFEKFKDFSIELANAGGMNDSSDGKISRFEFLTFVLVENGIIQLKDISSAMKNFREIDKTGTGYIEEGDLDAWMKEHAAELHSLKQHSHPGEKVHPAPA